MRKAFVYRLYPSKPQERRLEFTRETCRRFYNDCLAERKTAYEERGETIRKSAQLRRVKERKATNPDAKDVHSHILQIVVDDLDKAFQAFFRRVKTGEKPGCARFKGRNRWKGFGLKEYGNGFKIDGRRLRITGIGRIAVRWHRPLEGRIKTLRIVKRAGKWYAAFSCITNEVPAPPAQRDVGIDVGVACLLTTSDGEKVDNPRWHRVEQRKLRVLQRRVARRKKGGSNRKKAVLALQRQHERIANRRKDFLNKLVHNLITRYDRIALEDLRITNMVRNPRLAKSILDASWGCLIRRLMSKAASAGRLVLLVDPRNTSQDCSQCGRLVAKDLSVRVHQCPHPDCGVVLDRDHNAAINILKRAGQVLWGISSSPGGLPQEAAGF
ncbi:transposase [Roseiflexus sp.]|uniref:RNA-guided endonuclease InsQ/TnpB family protein n=1 Tax=Roseiflexus sp. TaxID=2562120 RepID=UPI0021DED10E|nr:transposase [Roseiflexus sp.]GIW03153.1 MAG: transposase [Roseiflexus sp.]